MFSEFIKTFQVISVHTQFTQGNKKMNISNISHTPSNLKLREISSVTKVEAKSSGSTEQPNDRVDITIDENAKNIEQSKLWGKTKLGAIVGSVAGAAIGVAAGVAGGALGALVGLAAAPLTGVGGAIGGAIAGFKSAKLMTSSPEGAMYLGLLTGGIGLVAGGMAGFYGGAVLGAAAGAGGGVLGAIGGGLGGATAGGLLGGGGTAGYELTSNKEQYPNLLKYLEKEIAKDAAEKRRNG